MRYVEKLRKKPALVAPLHMQNKIDEIAKFLLAAHATEHLRRRAASCWLSTIKPAKHFESSVLLSAMAQGGTEEPSEQS